MEKKNKIDKMNFEYLEMAAECLKIMAHPMRIRIVEVLSQGKYSVGQIADICDLPPNQTCEHLRLLKNHGLLGSNREGRTVYYFIKAEQLINLLGCIKKSCPRV